MSDLTKFYNIPEELRNSPHWSIGLLEGKNKIPMVLVENKFTGEEELIKSTYTDVQTHITFERGLEIIKKYPKLLLGYVITNSQPFACIDLDGNKENSLDEESIKKVLEEFDSYAEYSLSKTGCHIWVKGKLAKSYSLNGIEVYSSARFIVCTGDTLKINPLIGERQELLNQLSELLNSLSNDKIGISFDDKDKIKITNKEIIEKLNEQHNGSKFKFLFEGDIEKAGHSDTSAAFMALISMFAFMTKSNYQVLTLCCESNFGEIHSKYNKNGFRIKELVGRCLSVIRARELKEEEELENFRKHLNPPKVKSETKIKNLTNLEIDFDFIIDPDVKYNLITELAKWFYDSAIYPLKEVSILSALSFVSGFGGKHFNISNDGINLYIAFLAKSTTGKEAINQNHSLLASYLLESKLKIDIRDYLFSGQVASGPALIKLLKRSPSIIHTMQEFGKTMRMFANENSTSAGYTLRGEITTFYSKSSQRSIGGGIEYSDSDKRVERLGSVSYSILAESQPAPFYESITQGMIDDGFLSRWMIFEYEGEKPERNRDRNKPLPPDVITNIDNIKRNLQQNNIIDVSLSSDAEKLLDQYEIEINKLLYKKEDGIFRMLWGRAFHKCLKVSAAAAIGENWATPCGQ